MKTLLLALALLQQTSTPYIETVEVRINNIDVVVTDRSGKAVTGLRKEDFVVLEDGKPQTVTNFAAYAEEASHPQPGGREPLSPPGGERVAEGRVRGDAPPPRTARHIVFFIDEMALHPVTRNKLVNSAKELLQTAMQPGDEAMILTPAAAQKIALPFTSDRKEIGAALERVMAAAHSRAQTQDAIELRRLDVEMARAQSMRLNPDLTEKQIRGVIIDHAEAVRRRVRQRLGHLRSIVSSLGEISGRKALVLVTTSLPSKPGKDVVDQFWQPGWGTPQEGRDYYDVTPLIESIAQLAAVNGVTIYSLQPAFNMPDVIGGPDIGRARGGGGIAYDWHSDQVQNEHALNAISAPTGGTSLRGDGGVPELFRQISSDITTYYSLGYRATEQDVDKPHAVEVRVKDRPQLRVRSRRDVLRKSPDREMDDLTVAALLRNGGNALGIDAETGALERDDRQVLVPIVVRVPFKMLTFLPTANGMQHATFRVHIALLGERVDFATGEDREQAIDVPAAELDAARGKYFTYQTRLRTGPGKYRIAIGVIDPVSRLTGFRTFDVEAK